MAATEDIAIVRLGVEDAAAGLVLSTEARLEPERGRLAFLPVRRRRDRRSRRWQPAGRHRSAAALLRRQCLDQHGAGDREFSTARHRNHG